MLHDWDLWIYSHWPAFKITLQSPLLPLLCTSPVHQNKRLAVVFFVWDSPDGHHPPWNSKLIFTVGMGAFWGPGSGEAKVQCTANNKLRCTGTPASKFRLQHGWPNLHHGLGEKIRDCWKFPQRVHFDSTLHTPDKAQNKAYWIEITHLCLLYTFILMQDMVYCKILKYYQVQIFCFALVQDPVARNHLGTQKSPV